MAEFEEPEEDSESEGFNDLRIRLVEVYGGKVHHALIDGLYLNSGDLIALFEANRDLYLAHDMDDEARFTDQLIDNIRSMILGRSTYE